MQYNNPYADDGTLLRQATVPYRLGGLMNPLIDSIEREYTNFPGPDEIGSRQVHIRLDELDNVSDKNLLAYDSKMLDILVFLTHSKKEDKGITLKLYVSSEEEIFGCETAIGGGDRITNPTVVRDQIRGLLRAAKSYTWRGYALIEGNEND